MDNITPYPLSWPQGIVRTPPQKRQRSPFRTSPTKAIENVVDSLRGFQKDSGLRIDHPTLSSNMDLMGRLWDNDPGAAAWFMMEGQWVSFGVDRFTDTASNIQAIHKIIEARRTELRYGGLTIVRQTFKAFIALPPPPPGERWHDTLGVNEKASRDEIDAAFRAKAKAAHPDTPGGSHDAMVRLNKARSIGLGEMPAGTL